MKNEFYFKLLVTAGLLVGVGFVNPRGVYAKIQIIGTNGYWNCPEATTVASTMTATAI